MKKILLLMLFAFGMSFIVENVFAQNEDILYTGTASRLRENNDGSRGTRTNTSSYDWDGYSRFYFSFVATSAESKLNKSEEQDLGGRIGILYAKNLSESLPLYMGGGIDGTIVTYKDRSRETFAHVAVPLQLSVRIGNSDFSLEPFVGFHAKANLFGQLSYEGESIDYFSSSDMGSDYTFNRFQMGFQVGAGINIKGLYLGYEFRLDLTPLQDETKLKTQSHLISLGFNF